MLLAGHPATMTSHKQLDQRLLNATYKKHLTLSEHSDYQGVAKPFILRCTFDNEIYSKTNCPKPKKSITNKGICHTYNPPGNSFYLIQILVCTTANNHCKGNIMGTYNEFGKIYSRL